MNNKPKISVITVSYNSQSTILHTVDSVKNQDYKNKEHVIVDGQSTDWTLDILNFCKHNIDVFISEKDEGIYDAMNKGILASSGDIIGILNSDDFYTDNNILSQVVDVFEQSNCDCLYGDLVYVNRGDSSKIVRYWQSGEFNSKNLDKGWMLPHPTFFVKREVYEKYGLYRLDLNSAADYEMTLRLLYHNNLKVVYLNKILVKMRIGGKSNRTLFNRLKANNEDSLSWSINNLKKPLFLRFKKPLKKIKQFFVRP